MTGALISENTEMIKAFATAMTNDPRIILDIFAKAHPTAAGVKMPDESVHMLLSSPDAIWQALNHPDIGKSPAAQMFADHFVGRDVSFLGPIGHDYVRGIAMEFFHRAGNHQRWLDTIKPLINTALDDWRGRGTFEVTAATRVLSGRAMGALQFTAGIDPELDDIVAANMGNLLIYINIKAQLKSGQMTLEVPGVAEFIEEFDAKTARGHVLAREMINQLKISDSDCLAKAFIVENEKGNISDHDLECLMMFFVSAGHHTGMVEMAIQLWYWAKHTTAARKEVIDEIRHVVGNSTLQVEHIQRLEKTLRWIKEVERHQPIVPYTVRVALADVEIAGHIYGAGTMFYISPIEAGRSSYWGDPEEFDPARFAELTEDQKHLFIMFGLGDTECLGKWEFWYEMIALLVLLVQRGVDLYLVQDALDFIVRSSLAVEPFVLRAS